jgi:hypothetical protein
MVILTIGYNIIQTSNHYYKVGSEFGDGFGLVIDNQLKKYEDRIGNNEENGLFSGERKPQRQL